MKAKKSIFGVKNASVAVAMIVLFLASCQNDADILNATDTQNVNAESASSAYLTEGSDMSTTAIGSISTSQYTTGARVDGTLLGLALRDDRFKCATVTFNCTGTPTQPSGTITVTFDPTCTDKHGVSRSGTIVITYNGHRWTPGSYFVVKANFTRNDTHIEGKDSIVTKVSSDSTSLGYLQFESVLDGAVTFGDGKSITRHHDLTREWYREANPENDEWHTLKGGTAYGTCKSGATYQMQITKDLVHKISCLLDKVVIPVSGTKVLTVTTTSNTTKEYTVDYGDGTCDNVITVTVGTKEKTINVNGEGD